MIKDHGDHKAKAVQVANEFGVTPPTGSGIGAKATYESSKCFLMRPSISLSLIHI